MGDLTTLSQVRSYLLAIVMVPTIFMMVGLLTALVGHLEGGFALLIGGWASAAAAAAHALYYLHRNRLD